MYGFVGGLNNSGTVVTDMADRYVERSVIKFKNRDLYSEWMGFASRYENHEKALEALLREYRNDAEKAGGGNF